MKIEIGESLMLSYLKHVKKCVFYQTNWKVSSNWDIDQNAYDIAAFNFNNIAKHSEFSDVFKSELEQLIKQSEIDVIGLDIDGKIYTVDIAFHENGLNYGSKIETKNRVFKKLLRSYLTLLAYLPNRAYELTFASPKVNNATEEIIRDYFNVLNNNFSGNNVAFKYISNNSFRDEVIVPVIKSTKDDSDTNELFIRATKLSNLFNTNPSAKTDAQKPDIMTSKVSDAWNSSTDKPVFEFVPADERMFKKELLRTKRARRTWFYKNKNSKIDIWDASRFTEESSLRGNILSNNKVRLWKESGLTRIKFEIIN